MADWELAVTCLLLLSGAICCGYCFSKWRRHDQPVLTTAPEFRMQTSLEADIRVMQALDELRTLPERRRLAGLVDRWVVVPMPKRVP